MSNKEKVLAYFQEWAEQGVNLKNGCRCGSYTYDTGVGVETIYRIASNGSKNEISWLSPTDNDLEWELSARILKLDPPQAAPIKWASSGDGYCSDCSEYSVKPSPYSKGFLGYFKNEYILGSEHPEEEQSFASCQAHKQKRFNQLGGYNE